MDRREKLDASWGSLDGLFLSCDSKSALKADLTGS